MGNYGTMIINSSSSNEARQRTKARYRRTDISISVRLVMNVVRNFLIELTGALVEEEKRKLTSVKRR